MPLLLLLLACGDKDTTTSDTGPEDTGVETLNPEENEISLCLDLI